MGERDWSAPTSSYTIRWMLPPQNLPAVFTRRQASELGVTDFRLAGLVRRGELVKLRPGVYSVPQPPAPEEKAQRHLQTAAAALDRHQAGFVLSHLSAAAAFDLPMPLGPVDTVHLTAVGPTQRSRRGPGIRIHHCDSLATEPVEIAGIRATSLPRTVADCLREFSPRISVPLADHALHSGHVTIEEIESELALQCHWVHGPRAGASLDVVDGRRESWLESYAFVRFHEWGIDLPEPQISVFDEYGTFVGRVDGGWEEDATILEIDGKAKYSLPVDDVVDPRAAWEKEKNRFDDLGNLGLERVRLGLSDLLDRPSVVQRRIRERRASGSADRFLGSFRHSDPSGLRSLRH